MKTCPHSPIPADPNACYTKWWEAHMETKDRYTSTTDMEIDIMAALETCCFCGHAFEFQDVQEAFSREYDLWCEAHPDGPEDAEIIHVDENGGMLVKSPNAFPPLCVKAEVEGETRYLLRRSVCKRCQFEGLLLKARPVVIRDEEGRMQ